MLLRHFGVFLILSAVADAFVEFDKSRLYDEQDFKGQGTVYVPNYCSSGCKIYVSVPESSKDIARNIKIDAFQGNPISLVDADITAADGLKTPYQVQQGNAQVNFINSNAAQASAPVLVWIVRGDTPNQDAEVYDAKGTSRLAAPAGVITVLNTEPFTLNVVSTGPSFPFEAITAGFDALNDKDKCTRVIQEDAESYQDLVADVRSPLITLVLNSGATQVALTTCACSYNIESCKPRVQSFNCSLVTVELSSNLNVDDAHAVSIVADGKAPISWSGQPAAPSVVLSAKELTVSWTRNDADLNQYFMVRVQPSLEGKKTTTVETERTTTEPEVKTTTGEPEPAVRTTSEEPEPAIRTTTMEPELGKTSTVDDDLVKTTTESEKTTTMESEPVQTTTEEPETTTEPIVTSTQEPDQTTTAEPVVTTTDEAEKTIPMKTTTPYKRHSTPPPVRSTSTASSFHPKSTTVGMIPASTVSATVTKEPTTTSAANIGSFTLLIALAAVFLF